jgi:hypothetical protein
MEARWSLGMVVDFAHMLQLYFSTTSMVFILSKSKVGLEENLVDRNEAPHMLEKTWAAAHYQRHVSQSSSSFLLPDVPHGRPINCSRCAVPHRICRISSPPQRDSTPRPRWRWPLPGRLLPSPPQMLLSQLPRPRPRLRRRIQVPVRGPFLISFALPVLPKKSR